LITNFTFTKLENEPVSKDSPEEPLADLPIGVRAVVARVTCSRAVTVRLYEMGLVPGTEVTVTRLAPLRDPMELDVRGYKLSIRRHEAREVLVSRTGAS
jgi:Fe2+ transport system protein FeoA